MNVAILGAILGNKLNLKLEVRADVVVVALIHDIGKMQ